MKHRPNNLERRIGFNHARAQFQQALRRFFFRLEDGGLRHLHFPRRLCAGFAGLFPESFGKTSQFVF